MGDNTRLKKLRMQRCLSQRELAEAISIDRSMISLYENDRREIPTSTAKLFADFLMSQLIIFLEKILSILAILIQKKRQESVSISSLLY